MTQVVMNKKPLMCKYCNQVAIEFDVNRKSKSGKLLPIEVASGIPHSCSQNPWNQQKKTSVAATAMVKTPAETMLTISNIEVQELNTKLDKIVKQLTALCQKYDVTVNGLQMEA